MRIPLLVTTLFIAVLSAANHAVCGDPDLPDVKPLRLEPSGELRFPQITESSGLVKSRLHEGVFWTHNDSGDIPRIFPVDRDGGIVKPRISLFYNGILLEGARHVDWEDIAIDDSGYLYIGDIGNNDGDREVFSIYRMKEPSPLSPHDPPPVEEIRFFYGKRGSSQRKDGVNAEAIFWEGGDLYILSREEGSEKTDIYRLESLVTGKENRARRVWSFDFAAEVTGAEASVDGNRLAVLTKESLWLFDRSGRTESFFADARVFWLPIRAGQCEAVAFDGDELLISNEGAELFRVPLEIVTRHEVTDIVY
jgi:hypothetical protein